MSRDGLGYIDRLRARWEEFEQWRGDRNSYRVEEIPAGIEITNDERSDLERHDFLVDEPARYSVYVKELPRDPAFRSGVAALGVATTWTGDILGSVTFGAPYRSNFGDTRRAVWMVTLSGVRYHGTAYTSAGDYARIVKAKVRS